MGESMFLVQKVKYLLDSEDNKNPTIFVMTEKGIAFRESDSWSTDGEDADEELDDDSTYVDDAVPDDLGIGSSASWQITMENGVTCADQFASKKDKRKFFDYLVKIDGVPDECNPCCCCLDCVKTPGKCKQ